MSSALSTQVNTQASVQMKLAPADMASIGRLTIQQQQAAMKLLKTGYRGKHLQRSLADSAPGVRTLFKVGMASMRCLPSCAPHGVGFLSVPEGGEHPCKQV